MDTKGGTIIVRQKGVPMPSRKRYSEEFKHEAVKLVIEQHLSRKQVAADLGIDVQTLRRWVSERLENRPPMASSNDAELVRLRRENDLLRMERDILKKAIGIFSRMPQ